MEIDITLFWGSFLHLFVHFRLKIEPGAEKAQKCKSSFYLRKTQVSERPRSPK